MDFDNNAWHIIYGNCHAYIMHFAISINPAVCNKSFCIQYNDCMTKKKHNNIGLFMIIN